jgi:hypothetical protein
MLRVTSTKSSEEILEALVSVYLRLATPQEVEVRAVDNQYIHRPIYVICKSERWDFIDRMVQIQRSANFEAMGCT